MGNPQLLLSGDRAVVLGSEIDDPAAGAPMAPPLPAHMDPHLRPQRPGGPHPRRLTALRRLARRRPAGRRDGPAGAGRRAADVSSFTQPSATVTQDQALARNREVVRDSTAADWLPQVTTYDTATQGPFGSPTSQVSSTARHVSVPETFNGLGTLTRRRLRRGFARTPSRRRPSRPAPTRRTCPRATSTSRCRRGRTWARGGDRCWTTVQPGDPDLRVRPVRHLGPVRRHGHRRRQRRRELVHGRARRRAAGRGQRTDHGSRRRW